MANNFEPEKLTEWGSVALAYRRYNPLKPGKAYLLSETNGS